MVYDNPFGDKYPSKYISDGTENGFYTIGSFWDHGNKLSFKGPVFYGFMIGKGYSELVSEGSWDEPPLYEPVENEMIIVRPKLKYPKR
jgi:hypothetical protein